MKFFRELTGEMERFVNWALVRDAPGEKGIVLAEGRLFGEQRRRIRSIYLPKNINNQHLACIGSSGCGKTRFLYTLIEQILETQNGSVILIDPHGDLHNNVLSLIAQKVYGEEKIEFAERLVLIEPAKLEYGSIGMNVLEQEEGQLPYEIVAELVSAFHAIWEEAWGARMEDLLRSCCLVLQEVGLTLVEMPWLLMDGDFRKYVVSQIKNDDVKMYFDKHFHGFRDTDQKFFIESTRNKVAAFTSNPYLKPILGQQQSTVRFAEIMNSGKICLINLSRNHLILLC
jgi:energy-coupling factor transporter ATP-binding protein EcfA2